MKHILLLEDERDIALLLREALEQERYYVTFTGKLADARTLLVRMKLDLLVANVLLPDGTAFEAVDMAKQRGISAFLMTGSVDHMALLAEAGQYYLAKPFHLDDFIAQVCDRIGKPD